LVHVQQQPKQKQQWSKMHKKNQLTGILSGYFTRIFSASCLRCSIKYKIGTIICE